ncbi:MAG: aldo/keto reductase [Marinifilaceae bacterium]|jgi:alcohol dehydrogenase (NADP+)|nr:aldo/keto reductase [Marinifilaceae bacterium]
MKQVFKNGIDQHKIVIGTWRFKQRDTFTNVYDAIKSGFRHIDCATAYRNEREVGRAIHTCIKEGIVNREDLWITSKLWNDSHGEDNVILNLKQSLSHLGLTYLDSYLINWPVLFRKGVFMPAQGSDFIAPDQIPLKETWKGMEAAKGAGLTRTIGVSNFNIARLEEIMEDAYYKPEINQIEVHPYLKQEKLVDYCQKNKIKVTSLCSLGSYDRPRMVKAIDEPAVLYDDEIVRISNELNISTAQLIIAWLNNRGICPIIKSTNPIHMKEDVEAVNIKLSDDVMAQINAIDREFRYICSDYFVIPGSPYTAEYFFEQ